MKQSYSEEEISLELSKLDILLMFIRTSKGFSQDLQLTAPPPAIVCVPMI